MLYREQLSKIGFLVLVNFLLLVFPTVEAAEKNQDWVDRDRFPEAYSILTSDHIMFPGNVTNWPMKIDSKRQLFVDDHIISSMENLVREFHQPEKYSGNPLMPGHPVAVIYDEKSGKFRMWYNQHYAESNDGVNWTKPDVGPNGNWVLKSAGEVRGFIYNPEAEDCNRRYEVVAERRTNENTQEKGGFYLYRSADGLDWKQAIERPILQRTYQHMQPGPFWAKGTGDTSIFQYDPVLKKYTCSAKFNIYLPKEKFEELGIVQDYKPRLRLRTFMESDDLVHWTTPRFLLFPDKHDDHDCQIYGHLGFPYESMWIGMIRVMHVIPEGHKQVDLKLAYSRDGRHWLRPTDREAFIGLGKGDSWEADYSGYTKFGPTLVGDELWFYYHGGCNPARENIENWTFGIGLAKLRRDGFASLNADDEAGKIITRPMTFAGKKLLVNADVQKDGWIKVAVLTEESEPVASYELDDSVALTEDTTKGRMVWKAETELVPPGDEHVRLVFQLKNAKLYSFWIE